MDLKKLIKNIMYKKKYNIISGQRIVQMFNVYIYLDLKINSLTNIIYIFFKYLRFE